MRFFLAIIASLNYLGVFFEAAFQLIRLAIILLPAIYIGSIIYMILF